MKTFKKILCTTIAAVVSLAATGCGDRNIVGGITSSDNITILTTAAVGTPTTENDPYKQYIKDNYGLNATLIAATDFATTAQLQFSNTENMPDIVAFESVDSFRTIFNQGVLLSDWTPYLDKMPNFSKIINTEDADRPGEPSMSTSLGNLFRRRRERGFRHYGRNGKEDARFYFHAHQRRAY